MRVMLRVFLFSIQEIQWNEDAGELEVKKMSMGLDREAGGEQRAWGMKDGA